MLSRTLTSSILSLLLTSLGPNFIVGRLFTPQTLHYLSFCSQVISQVYISPFYRFFISYRIISFHFPALFLLSVILRGHTVPHFH